MKKNVLGLFSLLCVYSINVFASDLSYYPEAFLQGAKGSFRDAVLKTEIKKVLRMKHIKTSSNDKLAEDCGGASGCYSHTVAGYTKARQFLLGGFYLVKRSNDYAVREMYCQKEVGAEQFTGKKPGPNIIPDDRIVNVEHTWPQSKFSRIYNKEEQKSDLHHLYPTDSEMNSTRSSYEFGEVEKDAKPLKCPVARFGIPRSGAEDVFEPPQSHKGNVARALFYFSVKYELPISPEEEATLRVWHKEDPVDQEERDRNDAIFAVQFSRNPFVDLPELADRISDY